MAKMWAGRFSKEVDSKVNDFNSSISFDQRMYKQDIQGSIAHCKMLAKVGILTDEEKDVITAELAKIAGGKITHIDQESKNSAAHCLPLYTQNGVYATVSVPDGKTFILSMVNGVLKIYDEIK